MVERNEQYISERAFVTITEWDVDPVGEVSTERFYEIFDQAQLAAQHFEGWLGAMLLRSADESRRRMARVTIWKDAESRTQWQASDIARKLGLGKQPHRSYWELVADSRRND